MGILCNLKNINLSFGNKILFHQASITIQEGDRIGLMALNGHGKSTLFRIITGDLLPDISTPAFIFDKNTYFSVTLIPQELPIPEGKKLTVESYFDYFYHSLSKEESWTVKSSYESYLKFFGLQNFHADIKSLSGGEQKKILLSLGFASNAALILWDEPTNHLDLETIKLFEEELDVQGKSFVLVSHDRYLLSKVTNRIVHIKNGEISSFEGSYTSYLGFLKEKRASEEKLLDRLQNKMRRETEWMRQGIKARGTRSKKRVENYEGLMQNIAQMKAESHRELSLSLSNTNRQTQKLAELKNVSFSWKKSSKEILSSISLIARKKDKIGLLGKNGAGKTTLIKLITGEILPSSGEVIRPENLIIQNFSQKREELDPEKTPWEILGDGADFVNLPDGQRRHVASYFESFLFARDDIRRPIKTFSGGEKNRLQMAMNLKRAGDLWIFDEPTNDLDLETLQILEQKLIEFEGALILISHDRAFLNAVTNKVWSLQNGKIENFEAGYAQAETYLETLLMEELIQEEAANSDATSIPTGAAAPAQQQTKERLTNKEKIRLKELPQDIQNKEERLNFIENKLVDFDFASMNQDSAKEYDALTKEKEELETNILECYEELEELRRKSS